MTLAVLQTEMSRGGSQKCVPVHEDAGKRGDMSTAHMALCGSPLDGDCSRVREWVELVQEAKNGTNGAIDILNDLLNLDASSRGCLPLEFSLLSIRKLVEDVVSEFRPGARSKDIDLRLALPEDVSSTEANDFQVAGDSKRLMEVLR